MPRRTKPPGMEKWTWDEINEGRRMSTYERQYRRLAVRAGSLKSPGGKFETPAFADNPAYYLMFIGLIALAIFFAVLNAKYR
jgi:transposase